MRADTGSVPPSDHRSGRAAEDLHLPRVSVVIPTFNKYEYTRRCLESLRELVYPDIEIIVVDNASIDGTPDKIGVEFPSVRVLRNPTNQGYAAACNAGIHATAGPYILLLNNDTRVLDPFMIQTSWTRWKGIPSLPRPGQYSSTTTLFKRGTVDGSSVPATASPRPRGLACSYVVPPSNGLVSLTNHSLRTTRTWISSRGFGRSDNECDSNDGRSTLLSDE